jgi:hypothetical protein
MGLITKTEVSEVEIFVLYRQEPILQLPLNNMHFNVPSEQASFKGRYYKLDLPEDWIADQAVRLARFQFFSKLCQFHMPPTMAWITALYIRVLL